MKRGIALVLFFSVIAVLSILSISFVSAGLFSNTLSKMTLKVAAPITPQSCYDSDGGFNIYVAGMVNYSYSVGFPSWFWGGRNSLYVDTCYDNIRLYEYYCIGKAMKVNLTTCPNDYVCKNGACLIPKHLACKNYMCVEVDGVSGDECRIASDCQTDTTPPKVFAYFTQPEENSSWLIVNASDPESKLIYIGYWYRGPKNYDWNGWEGMYYNCTIGHFCTQYMQVTPIDGAGEYDFWVRAYNNQGLSASVYPNVSF